MLTSSKDKHS